MKKTIIYIGYLIFLFIPLSIYGDFNSELDTIITNCGLQKVNLGIEIMNIDSDKIVYSKNSEALFVPASNVKILTSITALTILRQNILSKQKLFMTIQTFILKDMETLNLKLQT